MARFSVHILRLPWQELQGKIELAAGAHAAYQSLNECGTAQLGQYNYKICPSVRRHGVMRLCCKYPLKSPRHPTSILSLRSGWAVGRAGRATPGM